MTEYRICVLDARGRLGSVKIINCQNDIDALDRARACLDGSHKVILWQGDRAIAELEADGEAPTFPTSAPHN